MHTPLPHQVDVLIVGAGLAGVATSWHLARACPRLSQAIVEARGAMGGTWDLFRYPGVRSDSDRYTLGFSFRPWPTDRPYASGEEIRSYIEDTARDEGIAGRVRFHHRVVRASWSSEDARWDVELEVGLQRTPVRCRCRFLYACTGYYAYDHGHAPEWPDRERFGGRVVHPQHWPDDLDCTGRRIVVVGSGATAISLVPALARTAAHVTMLQRTPTYVLPTASRDRFAAWAHQLLPASWAHRAVRSRHALLQDTSFAFARGFPRLTRRLIDALRHRVLPAPHDPSFTPPYAPWDQRLCVDPDAAFLQAVADGRASVVTDTIERYQPGGLALGSGEVVPADVVVTATGLRMALLHKVELVIDGQIRRPEDLVTYRGMMYGEVPNFFFAIGYPNASWTLRCELVAQRVARMLSAMDRAGQAVCVPTPAPDMPTAPWRPLSSGYIARAALPRQGTEGPWRATRGYLHDLITLSTTPVWDAPLQATAPPRPGRRMALDGRIAVITGAARGIGRGIAEALQRRGCRLVLVDVDGEALAHTALELGAEEHHTLDVADRDAVRRLSEALASRHAQLDLLVNNAGVAVGGRFQEVSDADAQWLFGVNVLGPMALTRALLPLLLRSDDARVVNLSSLFGLVAPPGHVLYSASKFAVRGFSEGLRNELIGTSVGVTLVHPGGVSTAIAASARIPDVDADLAQRERARFQRWLRLSPEDVGERIVQAVEARRFRLLIGRETHLMSWLARLAPVAHSRPLRWALGR